MKNTLVALVISGFLSGMITASPSFADNSTIEDAIKSRSDLSSFYQALLNTGVNHELRSDAVYTVFAPTNDAFAKLTPSQYPCFYDAACRLEVANIVRNHIVPGEVHISDAVNHKGGFYSIDRRFIAIGEPSRNNYAVEGNNITSTNLLAGGMLYKINGVIINDNELAVFEYPHYAYYAPVEEVITTKRLIRDPACRTGHCIVGTRETTTVISPVPISAAAPAR